MQIPIATGSRLWNVSFLSINEMLSKNTFKLSNFFWIHIPWSRIINGCNRNSNCCFVQNKFKIYISFFCAYISKCVQMFSQNYCGCDAHFLLYNFLHTQSKYTYKYKTSVSMNSPFIHTFIECWNNCEFKVIRNLFSHLRYSWIINLIRQSIAFLFNGCALYQTFIYIYDIVYANKKQIKRNKN